MCAWRTVKKSMQIVNINSSIGHSPSTHHLFERDKVLHVQQIRPRVVLTELRVRCDDAVPLRTRADMLHHERVPEDHRE